MSEKVKIADLKTITTPHITTVVLTNKDNGETLEVEVKNIISIDEMYAFVGIVTDTCFDENTGEYDSAIEPYIFKLCTLLFYTNIDVDIDDENMNSEFYQIIYSLGDENIQSILSNIDAQQISDIGTAITNKVSYLISHHDSLATREVLKLTEAINGMVDGSSNLLDGADPEEIMEFIEKAGNVSEEQIIKEVLNKTEG